MRACSATTTTRAATPASSSGRSPTPGSPTTRARATRGSRGRVVAVLGEVEVDAQGLTHDKSSDMAAVLVQAADGSKGLLAFTSTETMARWDPQARPVPVTATTAATAAIQDGAEALLVDLAGPVTYVVEGADRERLAAGWRLVGLTGPGEGGYGWIGPSAE